MNTGREKGRRLLSGNKCSLAHCKKSKRDFPGIKLFKLPSNDDFLFIEWAKQCGFTEDFVANSGSLFLCEDHFLPENIGQRYLKKGAIPVQNLSRPMEKVENTEEDPNLFQSPPRKRIRSESPAESCRQCHRHVTTLKAFQKIIILNKKNLQYKKKRLELLEKENVNLKKRVERLKQKVSKNFVSEIDSMALSENENILVKMLIKEKSGRRVRWNTTEKLFAQSIFLGHHQPTYFCEILSS